MHCSMYDAAVLFENHCERVRTRRQKKTDFGSKVTFWFGTFTILFHVTRSLVGHDKTCRQMVELTVDSVLEQMWVIEEHPHAECMY